MKKIIIILCLMMVMVGCAPVHDNTDNNTDNKPSPTDNPTNNTDNNNKKEETTDEGVNMNVEITTINKEASDGKENEGKETVELKQAKVIFNRLPETLEELQEIDRTGEDGKFVTMALLICAFKTWTPDDTETCEAMMKELLNSPTVENNYTDYTRSFVKERMNQNDKWEYIADAYFDGAQSLNAYLPDDPLTITLREYPYAPQESTMYGTKLSIEKIVIEFEGADSERSISVYQDPKDNKWYVWSDTYKALLADIKFPAK